MQVSVIPFLSALCMACLALTAPSGAAVRSPQVSHTGKAPTGYTVTFRFSGPAAKKVLIKGEWYFARPSGLAQIAGTPEQPWVQGQGLLPKDWQPGDFPLVKFDPANNRALDDNWPVAEMTKGKNGVWTYTTPLPSGVFTYSFAVDCAEVDTLKCKWISDPNNRPWNETKTGVVDGTVNNNSQVYVPSDPAFHTVDYSWQGPSKHPGKMTHITYPSPGHGTPKDTNYMVIYTPPDYDPARAKPYPTLYISQGYGSGAEMNWATQAVVANIVDNLINDGEIQPMLVVMGPSEAGFLVDGKPLGFGFGPRQQDLIDNVIPYVEKHYHVSPLAADRAYTGGGGSTVAMTLGHPELFKYFGITAAGLPEDRDALTPAEIAALKDKSIMIGGGWQDITFAGIPNSQPSAAKQVRAYARAGIPVTTDFINGGHEYYMYRILLRDFLTRVAFRPLPYANW